MNRFDKLFQEYLIGVYNSLDPDQDRRPVGTGLGTKIADDKG